jgi:hypothetical protein
MKQTTPPIRAKHSSEQHKRSEPSSATSIKNDNPNAEAAEETRARTAATRLMPRRSEESRRELGLGCRRPTHVFKRAVEGQRETLVAIKQDHCHGDTAQERSDLLPGAARNDVRHVEETRGYPSSGNDRTKDSHRQQLPQQLQLVLQLLTAARRNNATKKNAKQHL